MMFEVHYRRILKTIGTIGTKKTPPEAFYKKRPVILLKKIL